MEICYFPSKMNPADDASHGLDANKNTYFSNWFKGPEFLWHNEISWPAERTEAITDEDPEVKHLLIVNRIAENYGMVSYLTENIWLEKTEQDSSHNDPVQAKTAKDYQAKEAVP